MISRPIRAALQIASAGLLLALAGCGGNPVPTISSFSIDATEFAFSQAALSATAGDIKVTLANKGVIEHDYTIDALSVMIYTAAGETKDATFTVAVGTYEYYCSIAGHKQSGMVGTLTVR